MCLKLELFRGVRVWFIRSEAAYFSRGKEGVVPREKRGAPERGRDPPQGAVPGRRAHAQVPATTLARAPWLREDANLTRLWSEEVFTWAKREARRADVRGDKPEPPGKPRICRTGAGALREDP